MPVWAGPWQQKSREGSELLNWDATGDFWTFPAKTMWWNEEVCNRIQNAIGVHDDLLTMVKKQKFRWYGHISRSSGMAKTILQGKVKGARRSGRRRRDWKITSRNGWEWGLEIPWGQQDREGWKGIVATSSVVPPTTSKIKILRWDVQGDSHTCIKTAYFKTDFLLWFGVICRRYLRYAPSLSCSFFLVDGMIWTARYVLNFCPLFEFPFSKLPHPSKFGAFWDHFISHARHSQFPYINVNSTQCRMDTKIWQLHTVH